jgi:hypothetical protein
MTLLRRGVSIVVEQAEGRDCPIEFSSGSITIDSPLYDAGAIVPRGPWRTISASELREIADPNGEESESNSVKIVPFPVAFVHRFHELVDGVGELTPLSLGAAAGRPAGRSLLQDFRQYVLATYGVKVTTVQGRIQGGFCLRGKDLETVTTNGRTGLLVGLHVDTWFNLPIGSLARAPIRVCANFGWNDRFFLFLNIPVDELARGNIREFADWANDLIRKNFTGRATVFARKFLTAFPDYPVGRVRVRPGEAYLAPTENLVHDGSTLANTMPDVTCHINGS